MADVQEQSRQIVTMSVNEMIMIQLRDLKESQRELKADIKETRKEFNSRIDKVEARMDKLENKIDALHNEIKSSTGHISIANISTVGIALGVLYSILSK